MTKARDLGDFISDGTIAETVTADGLNLGDNEKIQLGASQDLQIFHDGSNSVIDDVGSGVLYLRSNGDGIGMYDSENDVMLFARKDAEVALYHNGTSRLTTTSTGVGVTGTIAVSDSFNATSGTFTVQSNGTDILNLTSTVMSPQTDGAISLGSSSNGFNNMYLDGSAYVGGNVGIGTTSPQSILSAKVSTSRQLDVIKDSGDDHLVLKSSAPDASYNLRTIELAGERVAFSTGASSGTSYTERMRIDSSGNVLVGATSFDSANNGFGMSSTGGPLYTTATAQRVVIFNRRSSDGEILNLRKDGSTVGGIESDSDGGIVVRGGNSTLKGTNGTMLRLTGNTSGVSDMAQIIFESPNSSLSHGEIHFKTMNDLTTKDVMTLNYEGKVGIGTSSPSGNLQVLTSTSGTVANITHDTGGSYPKASGIGLGASSTSLSVSSDGSTVSFVGGAGMYAENTAASGNPTNLVFWTNASGTPSEKFRFGSSGQLGIGGSNYGTSGQVLTSGGSGAAPSWTTISAGAPFSGFGS